MSHVVCYIPSVRVSATYQCLMTFLSVMPVKTVIIYVRSHDPIEAKEFIRLTWCDRRTLTVMT